MIRSDLHLYQTHTAEFICNTPRPFVMLDLGLGKTVSTLTAIVDLIDTFTIRKVLIVAPLRVATTTWPEEIAKWEHTQHLRISVVCGNPKQREAALRAPADIYVTNVDNFKWLETFMGSKFDFDMMVLDESTNYKSPSSKRFLCARRCSRRVPRVVLLTATPSPNGLVDLWAQTYLLDGGARLGPSVTNFRATYFKQVDKDGRVFAPRRGAEGVIYRKLSDITLALRAEDYLSMPDKTFIDVHVELDTTMREVYDNFESTLVSELPEGTIEAFSATALLNKLAQYANGHVYDADRNVHVLHDAKIDALVELVAEAQEPVMVGYTFQSDVTRIKQALPQAVLLDKDPTTIARWNRGEIPVLLVHPAAGGHGLNLQHGGRHLVWFGLPWNLEWYAQLNGRLHRQGQTKPVFIHHLIAVGTVDETIARVLRGKDATQNRLLDALKVRLSK